MSKMKGHMTLKDLLIMGVWLTILIGIGIAVKITRLIKGGRRCDV